MKAREQEHYHGYRQPRGRQGDLVLLRLECNFCSCVVSRHQVLPGYGFAKANRMHGAMQSHIRAKHPEKLQAIARRVVDGEPHGAAMASQDDD